MDARTRPNSAQVMIKLRKLDEKTTGGLFVPTADAEKPKEGFVIAAGPGRVNPDSGETFPCPVKEGDLVLIKDFTGEKVDYDGAQHVCPRRRPCVRLPAPRPATSAGRLILPSRAATAGLGLIAAASSSSSCARP
jgi:chaperonin GroES